MATITLNSQTHDYFLASAFCLLPFAFWLFYSVNSIMVPVPFKNRFHSVPYLLGTFGKMIVHKTKYQHFSGTGKKVPAQVIGIAQGPRFGIYIRLSVAFEPIFQGAGYPAYREEAEQAVPWNFPVHLI